MYFALLMVALSAVASLLVWLPVFWGVRRFSALVAVVIEIAASVCFIYVEPSIWSALFTTAAAYKVINYFRLVRGRTQVDYLRRVSLRTSVVVLVVQLAFCLAAAFDNAPDMTMTTLVYMVAAFQLLVGLVLLSSTSRHLKTTKTLQATTSYTDRELPSLSVLIPARNETDDLHDCLRALTASTYPKLEIIVLDDCSQDKRTPEIIRSFAHDGVRFIAGQAPTDSWLAKNYAYQQLADAANGEYLLFCGVDLRMTPGAITELITTMLEKQKLMLSILPQNARPRALRTLLVQPMRYAWELSLPRRLFNRPPILSTCWIIKRSFLETAGSFKATSRTIVPESYFARATARQDGYSFLRSNLLVSDKPVIEQLATTVRMRYPQLHRRMELVWALSLAELVGLVLPLPLAISLALAGHWPAAIAAALAYLCNYAVFLQVSGVMYGRPVVWGFVLTPLMTLYDVLLLNYSMYRYEFRDVQWKERNICLPIMRVNPPALQK